MKSVYIISKPDARSCHEWPVENEVGLSRRRHNEERAYHGDDGSPEDVQESLPVNGVDQAKNSRHGNYSHANSSNAERTDRPTTIERTWA